MNMIRYLHKDIKDIRKFRDKLSEAFAVKQEVLNAHTIFEIYFTVVLSHAFGTPRRVFIYSIEHEILAI